MKPSGLNICLEPKNPIHVPYVVYENFTFEYKTIMFMMEINCVSIFFGFVIHKLCSS
jgi:hypothetical protein